MPNDWDRNRNEWARLTQGDNLAALQQQTYLPGGYARVPSYAPSQTYLPGGHARLPSYAPSPTYLPGGYARVPSYAPLDGCPPAQGYALAGSPYARAPSYAPSDGYLPAQGYALAGSHGGYAEPSNPYISPYSAYESHGLSSNTVGANDIPEQEADDIISPKFQKQKSRALPRSEGKPRSKRSIVRERVARENDGEVSSTNQPKGLVEWRDGVFKYWDPEDGKWLKAAYHDQYRDQFIEEDFMAEGPYLVAPARGRSENDVTSSCSAFNQLEWNLKDRSSWKNVVDSSGNAVLYSIERPAGQIYDEPERLWWHEGNVLLDGDNFPVRPWVGVPRCFSSKTEGGRIEALRRILPMTIQDFRARMPRYVETSTGVRPLPNPSTFGHRLSRFRDRYQIPAFITRAASDVRKKQIIDQLPEAEEATTTEGLQVLTRHEIDQRKLSTRGKHLYKATGRAISEDERRLRDRKLHQKLERQAEALQHTRSMPATPGQPDSPSPDLAMPPPSRANNKRRRQDDLDDIDPDLGEPAAKRARRGATSLGPSMGAPLPTLFEDDLGQVSQEHEETNTTAIASNNTPPPTKFDHRFIEPQTPLQQLRIQAALFYPRAHFYALIGEHPPHTSEGTYADQYFQIVALLEQKWQGPGEVPCLADIGAWDGSFEVIPAPILEHGVMWSILYPGNTAIASDGSDSPGSTVDASTENSGGQGSVGDDTEWNRDLFDLFAENENEDESSLFGTNDSECAENENEDESLFGTNDSE